MRIVMLILLLALCSCSSAPKKLLMKNCDKVGSNLYECEEIPAKEVGGNRR